MRSSQAWQDDYGTQEDGGIYVLMEHVRLQPLNCSELRKMKFGNGTMHSKCATHLGFSKRGVGAGCES
jgi:hypothetical protein